MNSSMFNLNYKDLLNGLVVAVGAVVLGAFQQMLTAHGLDFASYEWGTLLNVAITAGGAYLGKKLFSTSDGKLFGKIG